MAARKTPPYFFPSTVVMVDDSPHYLRRITTELDKSYTCFKTFTSPKDAAKFFIDEYHLESMLDKADLAYRQSNEVEFELQDEVRELYKGCYEQHRFDRVSVLIVDYNMPGKSGIKLLQELSTILMRLGIKSILLTGIVEDTEAIVLFNDGLIDGYINKGDNDFNNNLDKLIFDTQKKYFTDIMASFTKQIAHVQEYKDILYLNDPVFFSVLWELYDKADIVEHYFSRDSHQGFLLLNSKGVPSVLMIKSEDEINDQVFTAQMVVEKVPEAVKKELTSKKKMLYLPSEEILAENKDLKLEDLLFPSNIIEGSTGKYYYTHITKSYLTGIDQDKITTFTAYTEQMVKQRRKK